MKIQELYPDIISENLKDELSSSKTDVTREGAMQAFTALRAQARANGVSGMSSADINREIDLAREESGSGTV